MVKLNRRKFLQIMGSVAAAAVLPGHFPKPEPEKISVDEVEPVVLINTDGGELTLEKIEEAAIMAAQQHGQPDMLLIPEESFKALLEITEEEYCEILRVNPRVSECIVA